jgi:hypothetical protein
MKKLSFLIAFVAVSVFATAQSTTPRYGSGVGNDNTGRVLTYKYQTASDAVGADTVTLSPNAWETIVRIAVVDSVVIGNPNVTRSYAGDNIKIVASGASGKKVKFSGSNILSAGTATLSSVGRAVITLVFDGAKWVESCRTVQ